MQELNGATPPAATANLLTGLGIDEYFSRTDSSGAMRFLTDALGSTIGLVNSAGSIATSYTYQPFGATTTGGNSNANPYQFTGRENDGNGLYFYRARYYSPTFQRFVSQDPIGFTGGGPNLYAYVHNSATNISDAVGLWSLTVWGYYGYGGSISIGVNPDGRPFISGGGGGGAGAGVSFDPKGTSPGYGHGACPNPGSHWLLGPNFYGGVELGPFGLNVSGAFGAEYSNSSASPNAVLQEPELGIAYGLPNLGIEFGGGGNVITGTYIF